MSARIEQIKKFLKDQPQDCFLHHALALEYIKIGADQDALAEFEINLCNDPSYVATYYHLAKLYEKLGFEDKSIATYEQGMVVAKSAGDMHAYSELRSAHEELTM